MPNVTPLTEPVDHCRWPECQRPPIATKIPLCDAHFTYIGQEFMAENAATLIDEFNFSVQQSALNHAYHLERRLDEGRAKRVAKTPSGRLKAQSQVYYVRLGDHIKIGYTVNMTQRMNALRADLSQVLATEPGGRELEAERHQQFAAERVSRREDFNPSRRLLAHIEEIRAEHGEPLITTWVKPD